MIPRIVVHAGGPKTGSGSIQRAFNPQKPQISKDLLEKLDFQFLFSKQGITSNLGGLVNDLYTGHLSSYELEQWRQFFFTQFALPFDLKSRSFIFSAERMGSPHLTLVRCARAAEFVNSLGRVTEIIYYGRPLISLALSLGLQKAKSGDTRGIARMINVSPRHIVDKYLMYASSYNHAKISFYHFDRQALLGADVRIDIASRICKFDNSLPDLEAQISLIPPANEKVDLPILLILKRLYQENSFRQDSTIPQIFINFITMGKWAGPPCALSDIYTYDEIEALYQISTQELSELRRANFNASLISLADFFHESMKPKDCYITSQAYVDDSEPYGFRLTEAQRNIIHIILSKMRSLRLRKSAEFKILLPLETDTLDKCHCANELVPIILKAAMLIS